MVLCQNFILEKSGEQDISKAGLSRKVEQCRKVKDEIQTLKENFWENDNKHTFLKLKIQHYTCTTCILTEIFFAFVVMWNIIHQLENGLELLRKV